MRCRWCFFDGIRQALREADAVGVGRQEAGSAKLARRDGYENKAAGFDQSEPGGAHRVQVLAKDPPPLWLAWLCWMVMSLPLTGFKTPSLFSSLSDFDDDLHWVVSSAGRGLGVPRTPGRYQTHSNRNLGVLIGSELEG